MLEATVSDDTKTVSHFVCCLLAIFWIERKVYKCTSNTSTDTIEMYLDISPTNSAIWYFFQWLQCIFPRKYYNFTQQTMVLNSKVLFENNHGLKRHALWCGRLGPPAAAAPTGRTAQMGIGCRGSNSWQRRAGAQRQWAQDWQIQVYDLRSNSTTHARSNLSCHTHQQQQQQHTRRSQGQNRTHFSRQCNKTVTSEQARNLFERGQIQQLAAVWVDKKPLTPGHYR